MFNNDTLKAGLISFRHFVNEKEIRYFGGPVFKYLLRFIFQIRIFSILIVIVFGIVSCAQKEKKDRTNPAAFVTEIFAIDNGLPMREVQKQEFYFKKCELESRRPFQSRVEFSCNEN